MLSRGRSKVVSPPLIGPYDLWIIQLIKDPLFDLPLKSMPLHYKFSVRVHLLVHHFFNEQTHQFIVACEEVLDLGELHEVFLIWTFLDVTHVEIKLHCVAQKGCS